jgi:hypothetical protein
MVMRPLLVLAVTGPLISLASIAPLEDFIESEPVCPLTVTRPLLVSTEASVEKPEACGRGE